MDDLETKVTADAAAPNLAMQCAALQRQITTLLVALIVLSGSFAIFVGWQVHLNRQQLEVVKQQVDQIMQQRAGLNNFIARLSDFARTHPDFIPVLAKYGVAPTNAVAPVATPQPAALPKTAPSKPPATVPKK